MLIIYLEPRPPSYNNKKNYVIGVRSKKWIINLQVCHLQDGAYFGEIALLMKDRKRISTIIALEICETYRLDRKYFRRSFSANIELFQKFEKIANERMERTIIAEQVYRTFINRNSVTLWKRILTM